MKINKDQRFIVISLLVLGGGILLLVLVGLAMLSENFWNG